MIRSHCPSHPSPATGWLRLTVHLPGDKLEAGAALLGTLCGGGVEIRDETAAGATLISYIRLDAELEAKKARLAAALAELAPGCQWQEDHLPETDWNEQWKKHFLPMRVTERLVIRPSWIDYQARPHDLVIELDPGMAFGTGHHATTRLMLRLLEAHAPTAGETVLDVGTGTGILAMAAALLGCQQVTAVDNDPEAVQAALKNVERNRLNDRVSVSGVSLARLPAAHYDLLLANIVQDTLLALAEDLCRLLAPGGMLMLSGILAGEQERRIEQAYTAYGLHPHEKVWEKEWAAIVFQRPGE